MTDTLIQPLDVRQRFTVTGVVQGVGFRPFVYRIASELGLTGFVGNDSGAVFLEVQGPCARIDEFGRRHPPVRQLLDQPDDVVVAEGIVTQGVQALLWRVFDS